MVGRQRLPATHHQYPQWTNGQIHYRVSDKWSLSRLSKEIGGNVNNVLPVWGSTRAPPREDRRSYAGKSSDNFHHKWVDMLNTRYSFQWDLQTVPSQIQVDGSGDIPESVQTTSLKKVSQLEELCEDKTKLLVVHNFAVVILFCTWTCM